MSYKKIAVVGPSGTLGKVIARALLASTEPSFVVKGVVRPTSTYAPPPDVDSSRFTLAKVAADDHEGLVEAFKGQDAVVLVIHADQTILSATKAYVAAAVEGGVKMFIPSDFGSLDKPLFSLATPGKLQVKEYLTELANQDKISFVSFKNGAFFDMPLAFIGGIDIKSKKARLFDGGETKFHITTLASIAKAVTAVLTSPSQFLNKELHIHDYYTSQKEMLRIVEAEMGTSFETESVPTAPLAESARKGFEESGYNRLNAINALSAAVWGEEGAADWDVNDDSSSVGLGQPNLAEALKKRLVAGY